MESSIVPGEAASSALTELVHSRWVGAWATQAAERHANQQANQGWGDHLRVRLQLLGLLQLPAQSHQLRGLAVQGAERISRQAWTATACLAPC